MPLTAADLKRRALILKCEFCEYTSNNKNNLKVHTQAEHVKKHVKRVHMTPTAADLKRRAKITDSGCNFKTQHFPCKFKDVYNSELNLYATQSCMTMPKLCDVF